MNETESIVRGVSEGRSIMTTGDMPGYDGGLRVVVVRDEETLLRMGDPWNNAVARSSARIYQTFEWISLWWRFYGRGKRRSPSVICVYDDSVLVGIAPMFLTIEKIGGMAFHTVLRFMGCGITDSPTSGLLTEYGPSDYLDVIAVRGKEEGVGAAIASCFVDALAVVDEIECAHVPGDGVFRRCVLPLLESRGLSIVEKQTEVCPQLPTPPSLDEYMVSLSSNVRRRFSQAVKSVGQVFTLERVETPEQVDGAFDDLCRLHQRRWNLLGYPGLFADRRFLALQREMAHASLLRGWLWFKTARVDGHCVAARLGFVLNGRVHDYLSGFDDQAASAKRRPGLALLLDMIAEAAARKDPIVDFLRGEEKYKFEMTDMAVHNWLIRIRPAHGTGVIRAAAHRFHRFFFTILVTLFKEFRLVRVHVGVHGLFSGIPRYIAFRWGRFSRFLAAPEGKQGALS